MKYILISLLFLSSCKSSLNAQHVSYGFVERGSKVSGHDRIIKDTICKDCVYDNKKGNIPTRYHWVQYNIFEPPGQFEIMKWYWTGFPKVYGGWSVESKEVFYMHGYTEGFKLDMVTVKCDTCDYLDKYCYDVSLNYGYDDEVKLVVKQNKDTTDKYFKKKYPNPFPISIPELRHRSIGK